VTFSLDDLEAIATEVESSWRSAVDADWSVPAGTVDWTCRATADHAVDTVLAPAFFLASGLQDDYPAFEPFTSGPEATPQQLIDGLATAVRILAAVVTTADPDERAILWRRGGQPHLGAPSDFVPRAGLELVLHAHDVAVGLAVAFDPPRDACDRLRQHTEAWPYWTSPGWTALTMAGDPWRDLLGSSGRADR